MFKKENTFRKVRSITANYLPDYWGVEVTGNKIIAKAHFSRIDADAQYAFYGVNEEDFKNEGFTLSKECLSIEEAQNWISKEVLGA